MSRQRLSPRQQVVRNHPRANRRQTTLTMLIDRNRDRQRPYEMRRDAQQRFALTQRLPHQPKLEMLQISEPAMNQSRRSRTRTATDVTLIDQKHFQSTHSRVACDPRAVDSAADHNAIEIRFHPSDSWPIPYRVCAAPSKTSSQWCPTRQFLPALEQSQFKEFRIAYRSLRDLKF